MNFSSPGQEVDRYLLACDHVLPDQNKELLRSFVTSAALSSWSDNALSGCAKDTESPMLSLRVTDLARVIALSSGNTLHNVSTNVCAATSCPPKPKKSRRTHNSPQVDVPSPIESLVDAFIEVEGLTFPVNKSMMCHLSSYFYSRFTEVAGKGSPEATLQIENAKADGFMDCMNIVYGKPLANYSPGTMASSRLCDLLDLSTRLSLSPVRVFCSMELALPTKEKEGGNQLERYLLACHFNIPHCQAMLLASQSRSDLEKLDITRLAGNLHLDRLNVDVDDIRSLLSRIDEPVTSTTIDPSTSDSVSFIESSSFTKKSPTSDVVLQAGNVEFHVNRMVMGSLSNYFHKLLIGGGAEEVHFVIERVDPFLFGLCLHIMHGNLPATYKRGLLSSSFMFGLLEYAYRFDMAPVKLFCEMCNYEGHAMDRFLVSGVHFPSESEFLLSELTPEKIGSWLEGRIADGLALAQCPVSLTVPQIGQLINLCCLTQSTHRVANGSHHAIWVIADRNSDHVNATDTFYRHLGARATALGLTARDVLTSNGYTQILPGNFRGFRPIGYGTVYITVFYQEGVLQGKNNRPRVICEANPLNRNVNVLVTKGNQVLQTRNGTIWVDIYGRNHQRNKW